MGRKKKEYTTVDIKSLSMAQRQELAALCIKRLYDAQKLRIAGDLRLQRLERDGVTPPGISESLLISAVAYEKSAEEVYTKLVYELLKEMPIVENYLRRIKGLGPKLTGLLIGIMRTPERFPTVAALWSYAGLRTGENGRAVKPVAGSKLGYNPDLKTTMWKIAVSFSKSQNRYIEKIYAPYKKRILERELNKGTCIYEKNVTAGTWELIPECVVRGIVPGSHFPFDGAAAPTKDPEWSRGRIHNMALRYVAKMFLSHLWEVWRTLEKLPVREPYAIEYLGHTTKIDPWDMCDRPETEQPSEDED